MKKYFKIALKNVFRQKKRTFSLGATYTFVTILLVLLFGFSAGAVKNITNNISISIVGQLNVFGFEKINGKLTSIIRDYNKVEKVIKDTFKDATIYPRFTMPVNLYYNGFNKNMPFKGIKVDLEKKFPNNLKFLEGSYEDFINDEAGMLITKENAEYFGLKVGDSVVTSIKTIYGAYNTGIFVVRGIYKSTNIFSSMGVITHHDYLAKLSLMPEGATESLNIYFKNSKNLEAKKMLLIKKLKEAGIDAESQKDIMINNNDGQNNKETKNQKAVGRGPGGMQNIMKSLLKQDFKGSKYFVLTIDEVLAELGKMSTAINSAGIVIAIVMFLIIGVALFVNIRMSINDRMREIGTLRTIGMKAKDLVKLFILENIILGAIFTIIGIIIGLIIMGLVSLIKINTTSQLSAFLNNGHFYFAPNIITIFLMFLIILVFSAFFSYFPSKYAGKIKPVEALRKEF